MIYCIDYCLIKLKHTDDHRPIASKSPTLREEESARPACESTWRTRVDTLCCGDVVGKNTHKMHTLDGRGISVPQWGDLSQENVVFDFDYKLIGYRISESRLVNFVWMICVGLGCRSKLTVSLCCWDHSHLHISRLLLISPSSHFGLGRFCPNIFLLLFGCLESFFDI